MTDVDIIKRWYVIHVRSGFEAKVIEHMNERIKTHKSEDKFGEIVVPTEEVVEMKAGQKT